MIVILLIVLILTVYDKYVGNWIYKCFCLIQQCLLQLSTDTGFTQRIQDINIEKVIKLQF